MWEVFFYLFPFLRIHFHFCVYFKAVFNTFGFSGLASQVRGKLRHWRGHAGFATNSVTLDSLSLGFVFGKLGRRIISFPWNSCGNEIKTS